MLTYQQQFQQDVDEMVHNIIDLYIQVLDRCAWHDWAGAESLISEMAARVSGLETYIAVLGDLDD